MVPLIYRRRSSFNVAEAYAYLGQSNGAIALLNTYLSTRIVSYNSSYNLTTAKINSYYGTTDTYNRD